MLVQISLQTTLCPHAYGIKKDKDKEKKAELSPNYQQLFTISVSLCYSGWNTTTSPQDKDSEVIGVEVPCPEVHSG